MLKKYSISILAATVAASVSVAAIAQSSLQVVDLGAAEGAYVTYPGGMNELGEAVVVNRELWQQNIRFDLLEGLEALEELDFSDISDAEYRTIRNLLNSPNPFGQNPSYQNLAQQISHLFDGQVVELDGFDVIDPETNRETDSVNYLANDINQSRVVVGTAGEPYLRRWTTDTTNEEVEFFMRDTFPRAFAHQFGEVTFLPGKEGLFQGGTSTALKINEQNQIVGRAAIEHTLGLNNRIALCQDLPEEDDNVSPAYEELDVCVWRYWHAYEEARPQGGNARSPIFIEQAYLWTLNDDGTVDKQHLGGYEQTFPEPEEEDEEQREPMPLTSVALGINNQGVAVGSARRIVTLYNGFEGADVRSSVIYRDGEIIPLQDEFRTSVSEATAINDNNIAVGYSNNQVGSGTRQRAFWVDVDDLEAGLTYPTGFFNTSGWRPRAINNQNVMVGRGEVTAELVGQRPTVGFMYDIETDTITDLNTLLPCNSGYRIVDAYDINDNGEILALATTDIGIPVDGDVETSSRLRAVRLQAGGEGGICGEDIEPNERKGAAIHPITVGFLAVFALLITRRRWIKS